jgi:hypothetical protein
MRITGNTLKCSENLLIFVCRKTLNQGKTLLLTEKDTTANTLFICRPSASELLKTEFIKKKAKVRK